MKAHSVDLRPKIIDIYTDNHLSQRQMAQHDIQDGIKLPKFPCRSEYRPYHFCNLLIFSLAFYSLLK
ncbi:hypothetical protein PL9631_90016 [Planktothrix paucivesiculata PCC 9631]|uniref:Uncharacterized protein n=1 Tax=Planktothrix paucivesiculata PCC 9631 TaxID=671071 RepID=A0A7Z9C0P5_9CYAN|nr:hypothetical protein PL9631_90016 [Planktothrix paucivesiculata PCC 9631]